MTELQQHLERLAVQPAESAALAAVEEVYHGEGRWEELLRVYEDSALRSDANTAAPLLRKAALLCLNELASAPRAEVYLKRALRATPTDLESLGALRQLYLDRGDYDSGVEVYERELVRVVDPKEKSRGLVRLAQIYGDNLARVEKALSTLRQAGKADPENGDVYRHSAAIYQMQGRLGQAHAALVKELEVGGAGDDILARLGDLTSRLLERPKLHELARSAADAIAGARPGNPVAEHVQAELRGYQTDWSTKVTELTKQASYYAEADREHAAGIWLTIAEIQLVYGDDSNKAVQSIDRALAAKPGHPIALRLLEDLYGKENRFEELSLKLEMMAAYTREPAVAVELYLKAAMHHSVRLDNPDASAGIHQRVLQLDPGNKVASTALGEYFREKAQFEQAVAVLSQWAERATQGTDKVAAHYACCRILEEDGNDKVRARPHYEAILALDPANQAAAWALEDVYRQAGDHAALAKALRAKLTGVKGDARLPILKEVGDLSAGPLQEPAAALEFLGELYQAAPSAPLREKLEEIAARANAFADLVQILEGALDSIQDDVDKVQALHSIAALYEGARDAPLEALRVHRRILALSPSDERSRQAVDRLLEAAAATGDKIAVFREQALQSNSEGERVKILHRLAQELVNTAKDYLQGIDVYREILKLAPSDTAAVNALLLLYRRDNRWAEVAELLANKSAQVQADADRMPLQLELAYIYEVHLAQAELAVDAYSGVLDVDQDRQEAIEGLERLLAKTRKFLSVAERLEPRFVAQGKWDKVVAMMEIRIGQASEPEARAMLLGKLAQVYEQRLQRPGEALAALLRAFQADPGSAALLPELERLAAMTGDFQGIIRAYRSAGSVLEGEERVKVVMRAGQLAEERGDAAGAMVDYLRVLGMSEASDAASPEGLRRLLKSGIASDKVSAAAMQVASSSDESQQTNFWRKMARFYEQDMNSPNDAIAAWKAILQDHVNDPEATAELDRLLESASDPAELVSHLKTKMESAHDDTTRAALGGQLAQVIAQKMGDLPGAIGELVQVAELVPGQRLVWQQLVLLYEQAGSPGDAAQAMHREINLLTEGPDRTARIIEYAGLLGQRLGDLQAAVGALQSISAHEPGQPQLVALIEQLRPTAPDPQMRAQLDRMLLAGYEASERWAEAVALRAEGLAMLSDVADRARELKAIAGIKEDKLGDAAGAYADLERIFHEVPLDEQLRFQLEQMAEKANAWEQLAQAYTAALGVIPDPEAQRPIRRKLAEVLDKRLGRGAEAVEYYKSTGSTDIPEDLASLEAMERLLREQDSPQELVEVLGAMLRHLPADATDRRKALLVELGQLCEEKLQDKARAIEQYKALSELDPRAVEPLRRLEHLLAKFAEPGDLAPILDKLIDIGPSNPDVVEDQIKRAAVATQLGDTAGAFQHYRAVLLKKREHPGALEGLEGLILQAENKLEIAQVLEPVYTAKQDHERLAWVLEQRLDVTDDLTQKKGLLRRIGDIYENRLQQKDRAFTMARRSLGADPSDMGVRMWIEKLAGETGAFAELSAAYVEEAAKCDDKLGLQFHRRAAALLHEKVGDTSGAVTEYRAILEMESRDEKALTGLETIYRATAAHSELVDVFQRRLQLTAGVERKREYLHEIAVLQSEQIADLPAAVSTYKLLLEITPDDPNTFVQIERLLAQLGQWEDLDKFYQEQIARLSDKRGRDVAARRLDIMFRRGRVVGEQFADRQTAGQIFGAILQESPEHQTTIQYLEQVAQSGILEAMNLLESVYEGQGAWQKYVDLMEAKLAQTAETERRREIYLKLSSAYDEHLKVGEMAFLAVSRAYNENRTDLELLETLKQLAERYGNWEELVEILGADMDAMADVELRQTLLREIGDISGNRLGDVQKAIGYLHQALQYDPGDNKVMAALDGLLAKSEMWAALADLLERRIEVASEAAEKSKLLERLAEVWGDRLMDAEAALRCHQQILEIDPDHPLTLKSMQKLYAEVQDWDSLAKNLARQVEVLESPEEQVRVHAAAGELYAEELGDNAQAISHWLAVVEHEPMHAEAVTALDVLLTAEERWEDLADHYRRQLTHSQDLAAKTDINRRLGVILSEKLHRTDDALASWLQVLQHDPKSLEAMRALLALYAERAMWEEFVGVAKRVIPLADPAEAKDVRFHLARALGENLGQRDEAIRLAREVRATEPHTAQDLLRLGQMLVNIEAFDEGVVAIEKGAPLEAEGPQKIERYYQAAEIYREKLEKPNEARGAYEAILDLDPSDSTAFTSLAEIYRSTGDWRKLVALNEDFVPQADAATRLQILTEIRDTQDDKLGEKELAFIAACRVYKENPSDLGASDVLERLAMETDGGEELVAVLEDEIDNIVDSEAKVASLRRIARIYAEVLKETPAAEETLNKILAIEPNDLQALDKLASLGASEDRFDKQIGALESKLGRVAEDLAKKAILFEIARIWEDRIGEVDEAISALNRVLEIDGADKNALNALALLFQNESRWTELAHTLTRKVELAEDADENVELRMRVAALCEGELGDPEAGIQWYRGVLDFQAGHTGALSALERLYTNLERWSELIQVFETQLSLTEDSEEKLSLLTKMGAIYESEFESSKDACSCFERILQVDSTHIASIRNLGRLLRTQGEWNRLIEVLDHHITLVDDREEITELYLEIGEIYYRELSRVDRAEQIYNQAREINPESAAALHALGQLYERSGNWFQSLEMLQREADTLAGDPKALPILLRLGRINEDMLMDMGAAQQAYQRALEIDPTYGPALQALKDIAKTNEDWDSYSEHLITEAETADDVEEKTDLFIEAANFFLDVRDEEEPAIRYFTRALDITPGHLDAARSLAEIHFRNERWEEAGDLYRIVIESLDKANEAKDFCQKSYRLGYISEKLGEGEVALAYYRKAFEADATYLPALEGLGQALLTTEQWDEAQKVFNTILIHHRESLTESEVVDVQWQLGEICLQQNQPDRAYKQFEKALEIDPDHGPALKALAGLDERMGNWDGAYNRLNRLAETAPGNERCEVLLQMSDIARERLADASRSIEALERARRISGAPPQVFDRLAESYASAGQGPKAVEVLEQAVGVVTEPEQLSELNFKLGGLYETAIKHEPMAVQKYNAALDASPMNFKSFEAIERLLAQRQEWALLEQNYRAMIGRAKDLSQGVRLVLWRNLAELYRQVMRSVDNAIMAYEVIQKMEPDKAEDQAILAELYGQKPEHRARAIEMQHDLLPTTDNPVLPIRTLRKLYHAGRDFDAVYMLAQTLVFLNEADQEEQQVFQYLRQGVPQKASRGLMEDQWRFVLHPDIHGPIGTLAAGLFRSAPDVLTHQAKDLGLKKKDHIDPRQSDLYFASLARYVGKVLNLQSFDIYRKAGSMEPLQLFPSQPPALVAGENNEVFRDAAQQVVMFHVGRNLAYSRPELFLARAYPGDDFRNMLLGLCIVYNRSLSHNGDPREVNRWAANFERMAPPALRRLQGPAKDAYAEIVKGQPLERYAAAVELTAARGGLIASGDVGAAVRGISEGGEGASTLPVRLRVKELVLFAVSREYLQLRKLVGAALAEAGAQASQ